eukprot:CAMPEP_0177760126 /NCGR_PEP_ID=MMETSP0491_2-20121128/5097_1 /TAXON_ID=63592 /ORGANISM="Tetraselmis chuii, Strain PLY429" /LENGTH=70 /DNA_ID=CAMNT_0019275997 /DNA_START=836 /DNA_END=1048 /DNA_ORIENTATION=+
MKWGRCRQKITQNALGGSPMACLGPGNVAAEAGHSCSNVWASADSRPEEGAHEAAVWNVRAECNITVMKG